MFQLGLGNPRAVFETTAGGFEVELFLDQMPVTVSNFLALAHAGFCEPPYHNRHSATATTTNASPPPLPPPALATLISPLRLWARHAIGPPAHAPVRQ